MPRDLPKSHDERWLIPYEHYLEAERLVVAAEEDLDDRRTPLLLAAAQVHATLATAHSATVSDTADAPPAEDVAEGLRMLREQREWAAAEADRLEVLHLMRWQGEECTCC